MREDERAHRRIGGAGGLGNFLDTHFGYLVEIIGEIIRLNG